jgi:hypothetical protein
MSTQTPFKKERHYLFLNGYLTLGLLSLIASVFAINYGGTSGSSMQKLPLYALLFNLPSIVVLLLPYISNYRADNKVQPLSKKGRWFNALSFVLAPSITLLGGVLMFSKGISNVLASENIWALVSIPGVAFQDHFYTGIIVSFIGITLMSGALHFAPRNQYRPDVLLSMFVITNVLFNGAIAMLIPYTVNMLFMFLFAATSLTVALLIAFFNHKILKRDKIDRVTPGLVVLFFAALVAVSLLTIRLSTTISHNTSEFLMNGMCEDTRTCWQAKTTTEKTIPDGLTDEQMFSVSQLREGLAGNPLGTFKLHSIYSINDGDVGLPGIKIFAKVAERRLLANMSQPAALQSTMKTAFFDWPLNVQQEHILLLRTAQEDTDAFIKHLAHIEQGSSMDVILTDPDINTLQIMISKEWDVVRGGKDSVFYNSPHLKIQGNIKSDYTLDDVILSAWLALPARLFPGWELMQKGAKQLNLPPVK